MRIVDFRFWGISCECLLFEHYLTYHFMLLFIALSGPMILRAWLAMLYRVLVSRQILQTVAFFSV